MSEPVKIAIVVEGGIVQSVLTAGAEVEYTVIDYDTEAAEPSDLVAVPQDNGRTAEACVWDRNRAEHGGQWVIDALQRFGAESS